MPFFMTVSFVMNSWQSLEQIIFKNDDGCNDDSGH